MIILRFERAAFEVPRLLRCHAIDTSLAALPGKLALNFFYYRDGEKQSMLDGFERWEAGRKCYKFCKNCVAAATQNLLYARLMLITIFLK